MLGDKLAAGQNLSLAALQIQVERSQALVDLKNDGPCRFGRMRIDVNVVNVPEPRCLIAFTKRGQSLIKRQQVNVGKKGTDIIALRNPAADRRAAFSSAGPSFEDSD